MIVLDSSAACDMVRKTEEGMAFRALMLSEEKVISCELLRAEVVSIFRKLCRHGFIPIEKVQSFLRQEGYRLPEAGEAPDVGNMLTQLSRKLCCSAEFPHEIGVFLGYPLGDVVGFIENRGKNFTCCGCWKSYGDPDAAQKHFDQLSKCTAVYLRLFHSGTPILRLAVAA